MPNSNNKAWSQSSKYDDSKWDYSSQDWSQSNCYGAYKTGYWNEYKYNKQWKEGDWIDYSEEQHQKKSSSKNSWQTPERSEKMAEDRDSKELRSDDDAWIKTPVPEEDIPEEDDAEDGMVDIVSETYKEKISHEVLRNRHYYSRPPPILHLETKDDEQSMAPSSQMPFVDAASSCTVHEDSQSSGSKRDDKEELDEVPDRKKRKTAKIIVDSEEGVVMKEGNACVREDWATVRVADMTNVGEDPINIASWVIIEEPTSWSYGKPTMRPASQFCEALEDQFQNGIGCLTYKLCFEKEDGRVSEVYFEHDLRKKPWVQRRYSRPDKMELLNTKTIHRILFQGSKEFEES